MRMDKSIAAQIYRLLPGRDCGEGSPCGNPKCIQFSKKLVNGLQEVDECPYLKEENIEEITMILVDYWGE